MGYVIRRLLHVVPVVFVVTLATFLLLELIPGDPAVAIAGQFAEPEEIDAIRVEMGLDKPLAVRYLDWLGAALQGDLGRSLVTEDRVLDRILDRLPVTLQLALMSVVIALAMSIPSGLYCGYRAGGAIDNALMASSFAVLAAPAYVLGILFVLFIAVPIPWIPAVGYTAPSESLPDNLAGMILPAFTIGLASWPFLTRVIRSDVIGTLQSDFISLAKAKGLAPHEILVGHALRPSSVTLLAVMGVAIAGSIDGIVIIETIFAIPGMGRLLIDGIYARDYILVQGIVLFVAVGYVVLMLAVDLAIALIDPRVRHR